MIKTMYGSLLRTERKFRHNNTPYYWNIVVGCISYVVKFVMFEFTITPLVLVIPGE